jgi:tetratricopeptide (TPR) repeat protein
MKKIPVMFSLIFISVCLVFPQDKPDALEMYRKGQYLQAIEICQNELNEMPRNLDSYTVMGWCLLALRRYQEALDESLKALQINPNDCRIIKTVGEALFYLGKNREALIYFEKYISFNPDSMKLAEIYYHMGEIYINLGEYSSADISLTTALYYKTDEAHWWVRLGYAREMAKDYQYAIEAYEKALMINPSLEDAIQGIESVKKELAVE